MLRMYFVQHWINLADAACEGAAVLHVLLDDPFSQPLTTLQKSASIR